MQLEPPFCGLGTRLIYSSEQGSQMVWQNNVKWCGRTMSNGVGECTVPGDPDVAIRSHRVVSTQTKVVSFQHAPVTTDGGCQLQQLPTAMMDLAVSHTLTSCQL